MFIIKLYCQVLFIIAVIPCCTLKVDQVNGLGQNLVSSDTLEISRIEYEGQLYGFWLGQCIANWTGLVTEMDKIGNVGDLKTGDFYTRDDWGGPDQPSIWGQGLPSDLSATIDFVFRSPGEVWGADDDTDIEYMYQFLHHSLDTCILSPKQIRDGWLKHIKPEEENFLWVSNQRAFDLMKTGVLPPATGHPHNNEHYNMIDAQLTTEIFGLFAPGRPDVALKIASMPIRTTARGDAELIARFYVVMHALASNTGEWQSIEQKMTWMAKNARKVLPDGSTPARMFDYTRGLFDMGLEWEQTRDSIYARYQVQQEDGYDVTSKNLYCNGCFAAGINFAASLVSLFYGKGDLRETIRIGVLTGWDSDNPTATWGGLIGFMIGKAGIEEAFGRRFASQYNIHRTRQNFPNDGLDDFDNMAQTGVFVTEKIIKELANGIVDNDGGTWHIPLR